MATLRCEMLAWTGRGSARGAVASLGLLVCLSSCAPAGQGSVPVNAPSQPLPSASATPAPASLQSVAPPFYIESLRLRSFAGGQLSVGRELFRGQGFSKYEMTWPSEGQTMTGTISIPHGPGPFPVVVVNHGFIPTTSYWPGADSGLYGDPMATDGFIAVAPNYPGYSGSAPASPDMPQIVATALAVMDLVGSVHSLPQADASRIAMLGHSFGGGVSLIVMVVDPRVRAFALYGPVSSDMRDSARKWWLRGRGTAGPLGDPDANPEGYAHISPRYYFDRAGAPALFLQGTLDEDIPADWTTSTVEALQSKDARVRLEWFPGAYHNFVGSQLATANGMAESWFRQAFEQCAQRCGSAERGPAPS